MAEDPELFLLTSVVGICCELFKSPVAGAYFHKVGLCANATFSPPNWNMGLAVAPPINVAYVILEGDGCYLLDPRSSESSLGEAFATIDVLDALLLCDIRGFLGDFLE